MSLMPLFCGCWCKTAALLLCKQIVIAVIVWSWIPAKTSQMPSRRFTNVPRFVHKYNVIHKLYAVRNVRIMGYKYNALCKYKTQIHCALQIKKDFFHKYKDIIKQILYIFASLVLQHIFVQVNSNAKRLWIT